jgi:hypothetical protein
MGSFFPRQTIQWKVQEPDTFRKLTLSIVEMAVITGIAVRLLRSIWMSHGVNSLLVLGGYYVVLGIILCVMSALHLGNFTVRHWVWRAPAFAALEAVAEMVTSLALIALGREPKGTVRAEFHDWPGMAVDTLFTRLVEICAFALVLAGVVQAVRYFLLTRENRASTAIAVQRGSAEHKA